MTFPRRPVALQKPYDSLLKFRLKGGIVVVSLALDRLGHRYLFEQTGDLLVGHIMLPVE